LNSGDWKLLIAPIPHLSLTAEFNRNHFMGVGDAQTNQTIDLYILQGRFALNPRMQLIAFYQENGLNHSRNYNLRFSWEYAPLSYFYLIYNHGGYTSLSQSTQSEDHVIAKISYLKQF
jgi:hypothetical protein